MLAWNSEAIHLQYVCPFFPLVKLNSSSQPFLCGFYPSRCFFWIIFFLVYSSLQRCALWYHIGLAFIYLSYFFRTCILKQFSSWVYLSFLLVFVKSCHFNMWESLWTETMSLASFVLCPGPSTVVDKMVGVCQFAKWLKHVK